MADETKDTTTTTSGTTTTATTTTTTKSGDSLTTDTDGNTQTLDSPYQGKRSSGGYVPT